MWLSKLEYFAHVNDGELYMLTICAHYVMIRILSKKNITSAFSVFLDECSSHTKGGLKNPANFLSFFVTDQ